jgi:hypothetical protein
MRYGIVARVEGKVDIGAGFTAEREGVRIVLVPGVHGELLKVSVSLAIPHDRVANLSSKIGPGTADADFVIELGSDQEFHNRLIVELQSLESRLSFMSLGALRRIRWDDPDSEDFIAESDDERSLIAVSSISLHRQFVQERFELTDAGLVELLDSLPLPEELRILEAFWREGYNFFATFQYVLAIFQFYFVIEDTFAAGKSGLTATVRALQGSPELVRFVEKSFKTIIEVAPHAESLVKLMEEESCDSSGSSLCEFVVRMRGRLHHYSRRRPKAGGTPFNQDAFESVALFFMLIATRTIEMLQEDVQR